MSIAIKVENLGKKYVLRHQIDEQYLTFRDVVAAKFKSCFKAKSPELKEKEEFWALKDLNFEINQGDRIGVIGRNGAGKSTLLKLISRITDPTLGRIKIKGRIASLLEVGTGFHPELTGRENIFLNGAILGMGRQEIKRKFDSIVAFAEIEKFLDTPVKRYSSGMYVRLAFAIAANLDPEIMIIDEVLAVGDAQFQKKCIGAMQDIGADGRTVIVVSHSMSTINRICNKSLVLKNGELVFNGDAREGVDLYLEQFNKPSKENLRIGDRYCHFVQTFFIDKNGNEIQEAKVDEEFGVAIKFRINDGNTMKPIPVIAVQSFEGQQAFQILDNNFNTFAPGNYMSTCYFPANFFNDMRYLFICTLTTSSPTHIHAQIQMSIDVHDVHGAITRGDYFGQMHGLMRPHLTWKNEILHEKLFES